MSDEPAAEWAAPNSLKPWARNPVVHPEDQIKRIAQSIKEFGFGSPLVARKADRRIVAGHARYEASKLLKLKQIPVRFMDLTEEQADALAIADRRLADLAEPDDGALRDIVDGFDDSLKELLALADEEPDQVEIEEVDLSATGDEFWLSVRGPVPVQPDVLDRIRDALAEMPGVEVQLGIIER